MRVLLERFLNQKLGLADSDDIVNKINTKEFFNALAFCQKHFSDELTLLQSDDQVTLLFSVLEKSLPFDKESIAFGSFNQHQAIIAWHQLGKETVNLDLHPLDHSNHSGIKEKFLTGRLNKEAWLTALDLRRFLGEIGMKNQVTVTHLDTLFIAMAIHSARESNKNFSQPYQIPLILNKGLTGDKLSQGTHWVYATITVNPADETIDVFYRDSLAVSSSQKKQLEKIFEKAIVYDFIDREQTLAKRYQSFPNYKLNFDIDGEDQQQNSWTCGYRAMRGLLNKLTQENSAQLPSDKSQFEHLRDCGESSDELRHAFYELMLKNLKISPEILRNEYIKIHDPSAFSPTDDGNFVLQKDFLNNFLKFITITSADTNTIEDMLTILTLEKEAEEQYKIIESLLKPIDNVLTIDITKIFSEENSLLINKAIAKAIVRLLNTYNQDVSVQFINTDQLQAEFLDYFVETLDQVASIENFATDTKPFTPVVKLETDNTGKDVNINDNKNQPNSYTPFDNALEVLEGRNALMHQLDIDGNPRGKLWAQLWTERFSNSGYKDSRASLGELALTSGSRDIPFSYSVNRAVGKMKGRYLKELFSFLQLNKQFFKSKPGGFPYSTLYIADFDKQASETIIKSYLEVLIDHFEKGEYFPFANIHFFSGVELSDTNFALLKKILIAAKKYPHINEIHFIIKPEYSNIDINKEKYQELLTIFEEHKLCFSFHVPADHNELNDIAVVKTKLNNIISTNRRQRNIALRADMMQSSPIENKQEKNEPAISLPVISSGKVRACKLPGSDYRQGVSTEINIEKQTESQYQLQTQLEQEVQQEIQLQNQQENDIDEDQSNNDSKKRISKQEYADNPGNSNAILTSGIRSGAFFDEILASCLPTTVVWVRTISEYSLPQSIKYLTPSAVGKLNANPLPFIEGFNVDNLPPGFFLAKYTDSNYSENSGLVLCYNEVKYIENKNQSPLTIALKRNLMTHQCWRGDLNQFIANASEKGYSENQIATFDGLVNETGLFKTSKVKVQVKIFTHEKLFTLMRGLNPKLASATIAKNQWCFSSDEEISFESEFEISALMDVLYHEGVEGVTILLDALRTLYHDDPDLYRNFKSTFIGAEKQTLMDLMSSSNLKIICELAALSPSQKQWWKKLVSEHVKNAGYADLETLYAGFKYFLEQWPDDLPFPQECPIEETNNMLVSLDRILAILSKVRSCNTRDQVFYLQGLDFGKEGAYYAARWDGFHFFHPAMKLTGKEAIPKHGYQVTYDSLIQSINKNSLDLSIVFFHRFIGRADQIAHNYQTYVDLTDQLSSLENVSTEIKIRLLPILALATTGSRGSKKFNADAFFQTYQELFMSNEQRLQILLEDLTKHFNEFSVQPDLEESGALIRLLFEHTSPDFSQYRALLQENISTETLQSFVLWQRNSQHISAENFLDLFSHYKNIDENNIGILSKITAMIKPPYSSTDQENLINALLSLKSTNNYNETLAILSSIDIEKTPHNQLPTIQQLITVINTAEITNSQVLFITISNILPECTFNRASTVDAGPFDLDILLIEKIKHFNEILETYNLEKWDIERLIGKKGNEYFQNRYNQLIIHDLEQPEIIKRLKESKSIPGIGLIPDALLKAKAKEIINKEIIGCLEAVYLTPIASLCAKFPQLMNLQKQVFLPPTNFSPENIAELNAYKNQVGSLFERLWHLRQIWGQSFSINFMLNSPRTHQFSVDQINNILKAIEDLNLHYVPMNLFENIFGKSSLSNNLDIAQLATRITDIIALKDFKISQKAQLVDLIATTPEMSFINNLVETLEKIQQSHPKLMENAFHLLTKHFKETNEQSILENTQKLLALFPQKDLVLPRLFSQAQNKTKEYNKFLETLFTLPTEDQKAFATIAAYGDFFAWEKEDDQADIEKLEKNLVLNDLANLAIHANANFKQLARLFDRSPRPKFRKIQQYVALGTSADRQQFIENYELDPPGLRVDPKILDTQFDLSTAHTRIDQIIDLARDNPLFYTHRNQLMTDLVYVNAVGRTHFLHVPGMGSEGNRYRKPAMNLTKEEIQGLIKHYRRLISSNETDPQNKKIAGLEAVALAREAMYRSTGMFAYSTQVISVLNVMLHGGDVFSEIRTGEGKGLITALFAFTKWMEGGATDVASANMALAGRDSEEFDAFYEYLGKLVTLIQTQSPHSAYNQDGSNYSDVAEMALFQEQMQLLGQELPDNVSLILDEADAATLDNTTQFRYAVSLDPSYDPHINPNEWAYPIILAFVNQPEFLSDQCPKEQDIINLRKFVLDKENQWAAGLSSEDRLRINEFKARFAAFSDEQLDLWIDSAYIASKLKEDDDFAIRNTRIVRDEQEIPARVARVKIDHRVSVGSTFSNGVQQFLHTRLNLEKRDGAPFPIEPEKTYLASKSSKNFIDYYLRPQINEKKRRGNILGLTGTIGSKQELAEMKTKYGLKFFKIPPHERLKRIDLGYSLARPKRKNFIWPFGRKETAKEAHFRHIKERIIKAHRRKQPVLLICDGVLSSQELFNYLHKELANTAAANALQLYNGEQDIRESKVIQKAAENGTITVSTPMLARGTDIKPLIKNGLYAIAASISSVREYNQTIGRSGRNGNEGLSEAILSANEFTSRGRSVPSSKAELLQAVEAIQDEMENTKAKERRERQSFADVKNQFFQQYVLMCRDLKDQVTDAFANIKADYRELWESMQQDNHRLWENFLNHIDNHWNELLNDMRNELASDPDINPNELLESKIKLLTQFANTAWGKTHRKIENNVHVAFPEKYSEAWKRVKKPEEILDKEDIPEITLLALKLATASLNDFNSNEKPEILDISARQLDPSSFHPDQAYLDTLGEKASEDLRSTIAPGAFKKEIDTIYQNLFNENPLGGSSIQDNLNQLLEEILNRNHQTYLKPYDGVSRTPILELHQRVMLAVKKYGCEADKQIAYEAHKTHIKSIPPQEERYLQCLMQSMYRMRDRGVIKTDADLSAMGLFDCDNKAIWNSLYEHSKLKLLSYAGQWWKSPDRKKALNEMRKSLEGINKNPDFHPAEKVNALITLINRYSQEAIEKDYSIDKAKWRISTLRNTGGSRFQETLDGIRAKAMIAAIGLENKEDLTTKVDFKAQISYLKKLLKILHSRAELAHVKKHKVIKEFLADKQLKDWITLLDEQEEISQNYQTLQMIKDKLNAYRIEFIKEFPSEQSDSQKAFSLYLSNVHSRIVDIETAITHNNSPQHSNNTVIASEKSLRDKLQSALQILVKENYVKKAGVDTTVYISSCEEEQNEETKGLLTSVLYEIERHVTLNRQYKKESILDFKFTNVIYDHQNKSLNVTAEFKDEYDNVFKFTLEVSGLSHNSRRIICQWPKIKFDSLKSFEVINKIISTDPARKEFLIQSLQGDDYKLFNDLCKRNFDPENTNFDSELPELYTLIDTAQNGFSMQYIKQLLNQGSEDIKAFILKIENPHAESKDSLQNLAKIFGLALINADTETDQFNKFFEILTPAQTVNILSAIPSSFLPAIYAKNPGIREIVLRLSVTQEIIQVKLQTLKEVASQQSNVSKTRSPLMGRQCALFIQNNAKIKGEKNNNQNQLS